LKKPEIKKKTLGESTLNIAKQGREKRLGSQDYTPEEREAEGVYWKKTSAFKQNIEKISKTSNRSKKVRSLRRTKKDSPGESEATEKRKKLNCIKIYKDLNTFPVKIRILRS